MKILGLVFLFTFLFACESKPGDTEPTEGVSKTLFGNSNLKMICEEAEKGGTAESVDRTIRGQLKSDGIKTAWEAIETAPPEMRYTLLREAAKQEGEEGWECPELLAVWQQ